MILSSDTSLERALEKRQRLRATLPRHIADHELLRPIGSGSYGEVWLGRNGVTGTYRAIKIIWIEAFETAKPYEREFEAIGRFEPVSRTHPGLVDVLQTGRLPNGFYYIMEIADDLHKGREIDPPTYQAATLAAVQVKSGSVEEAIRIGIALTRSLAALHGAGLIHRDIKPSNVIFVGGTPKLADIGLVAAVSDANSLVGTTGFIAPEGPTTPKSDIFSLGKLLYEVATGADRMQFPMLPEGTSQGETLLLELNQVLLKACNPDPRRRHASVEDLREELEFLDQGRSIRRVRQLEQALRWTRASLLSTLLVCSAVFLGLHALQAKRAAADLILERKIATALVQGNEKVRSGDYLAALSYFAQGAVWDSVNNEEHGLRLWSTQLFTPRVVTNWPSDSDMACFSDDGKLLVSIHGDAIRLTDVVARRVVKELQGKATTLAIDHGGKSLVVVEGDKMQVVNLQDDTIHTEFFPAAVQHVSVAGSNIFAVTIESGSIHVFPGNRIVQPENPNNFRAVFSHSGKYLVLLTHTHEVTVLETETLKPLAFHAKHGSLTYSAVFVRDERALITSSYDRTAVCWDLGTGTQIGFAMEHEGGVFFAAESPDGKLVATGSLDRTVKLWRSSDFLPVRQNHTLYHDSGIVWVKFIDECSLLAHCEDGTTWLWEFAPTVEIFHEVPFTLTPPEKRVIKEQGVDLRAVGNEVIGKFNGREINISLKVPVETIAINPQRSLLAIGTRDESRAVHSVRLFDAWGRKSGQEMPHRDGVTYVTFSHSGELIASCSEDFTARVWDVTGNPLTPPLSHKGQVRWAAFNATDEWLATAGYDETVRIWNARSGVAITPPMPVDNIVDYVAFEGDNELFLANARRNYRGKLELWSGDPKVLLKSTPAPADVFQASDDR
jgi:WD40 repeat protein/serine/threonine protein kinase